VRRTGGDMLKRIKIKNFKAIKKSIPVDIKPITFFVGPNSSGKSSTIQILLALKQTIKSSDGNSPLILQDQIDLGSYKDIM
jgi:predicted ATPase